MSGEIKILTVDDDTDKAESIQVEARSYLEPLDLRTTYVTAPGRADRAAIALAAQEPVGLVVAGMRGHSAMHDLILGSVSEHIMRSLELPILLVP
jgi:nucleotide-binding universal stress UspA family protein